MKILHVVGNRPQFIKLSPFLKATYKYNDILNVIVHSGQHYDYEMSRIFFKELGIPEPNYNLEVGSGTHGEQTGKMLLALDPIILEETPDIIIVYGDTNTTLAGALAGYKMHIPVAHVEAGMREYIWRPEEINKKIADHCSDFCFAPLERACENLRKEGIPEFKIFYTGDITYDAFLQNKDTAIRYYQNNKEENDYILLTLHRAETVDNSERLKEIVKALLEIPYKIFFPAHPRTKRRLLEFGLYDIMKESKFIEVIHPVGYFEFINLMLNSKLVITDSSGVLKEAFYSQKMCVTIDETTEYKEIFEMGYNVLTGFEKSKIISAIESMLRREFIPPKSNPFGDGHAAERMVKIIREVLSK